MTRWHERPRRKPTGGLLKKNEGRKSRKRGNMFLETRVSKVNIRLTRSRGGHPKSKLLSTEFINVSDPDTKSMKKAKIESVEENHANPHYIRRNIISRGAILKTDLGKVKVTSRPGQTGSLNGILVEGKK